MGDWAEVVKLLHKSSEVGDLSLVVLALLLKFYKLSNSRGVRESREWNLDSISCQFHYSLSCNYNLELCLLLINK